jgi:O-antigen ligase
MIAAFLALLVFCFFVFKSSHYKQIVPLKFKQLLLPMIALIFIAVIYVNEWTRGNLFLRYSGETYGTMLGTRDRDLATITSNRNVVFLDDLELWREYPVLGTGVGASKYLRDDGKGIPAHVELSRLLAEHGVLGFFIFILFLVSGRQYFREPDMLVRALKISLFSLAILTTFHSATRTFLTPLLLSLCTINIINDPVSNDTVPG